jgi:hypothetical protein
MSDVVVKIARVLGSFAAKRQATPGLPSCPHCGASRMVRSYVRYKERWRGHLLNRSPFRCGTCSRRSWHQAAGVVVHAVDDQAWREACREPDIDTLDLSQVDQQLRGVWVGKIASVRTQTIDWQIVALVRSIQERIQELQSRQHRTSRAH